MKFMGKFIISERRGTICSLRGRRQKGRERGGGGGGGEEDWDGIWSAIKFEATQIHFLRDVFVAGRGRRILKMDGV